MLPHSSQYITSLFWIGSADGVTVLSVIVIRGKGWKIKLLALAQGPALLPALLPAQGLAQGGASMA